MARGTVLIDVDRCKGCELCTSTCAQKLLRMSRDRFNARGYRPVQLVDPDGKCTGCALCALICPDVVLTIYRSDLKRPVVSTAANTAVPAAVPAVGTAVID